MTCTCCHAGQPCECCAEHGGHETEQVLRVRELCRHELETGADQARRTTQELAKRVLDLLDGKE